jgi:hypothetical protein
VISTRSFSPPSFLSFCFRIAENSPRTYGKVLPELEAAYNCVYLEFQTLSPVESGVEPWPGSSIGGSRLR